MMQEEELVQKDEEGNADNSLQDVYPFTISDGVLDYTPRNYKFTAFELFVTTVILLNTISGGFLEGYISPAIPSLLNTNTSSNLTSGTIMMSKNVSSDIIPTENTSQDVNSTGVILDFDAKILNFATESNFMTTDGSSENSTVIFEDYSTGITTPETLPVPLPLEDPIMDDADSSSFKITKQEGSWLGSLLLLGAALGAGISPWIIRLGRRHAIIASALPRLLGWILMIISTQVYTFYAGRFISGFSIGAISSSVPIYMSEISHPSLRGSLNCIPIFGVNVGIFMASLCGTFLEWRGLAVVGGLLVVMYFCLSFFIPNSPTWLVVQGREQEARRSLKRLRGNQYCIEEELQQSLDLVDTSNKKNNLPWKELLSQRRSLMPLLVVLLVTVVNRFSGYNAIITYCSVFISEVVPAASPYWAAVAVCLIQILATLAAMSLVDSWGRRKLLISSGSVMGLSLVSIALCEALAPIREGGTWVAVLSTMVFVGAYSLGIGPLTWVLLGELFPLDAREKASALVSVLNWLMAFLVTKTYFSLETSIGIAGTCLVYASVCLVGVVLMAVVVPETKGKTLSEIEAYFTYPQKGWLTPGRKLDQALSGILDQEAPDTYSTFY